MIDQTQRKIKSQKSAAIILIAGSFITALWFLKQNDFQLNRSHVILVIIGCIVVGVCGITGLRNSLRKQSKM